MKAKDVRNLLAEKLHPDKCIAKKDGSFEVRDGYFYRHGRNSEKFAAELKAALPEAVIINHGDNWAPWPHESYFWVKFLVPEKEA